MRADRLVSILLLLQNRGKMTSRDLAQTLEVSERTIFRDMEALSAAGIPVLAERGREGGWMLTEGYRTSLTGMKPKEITSLLLSADSTILSDLGIEGDFSSAARKLEAVVASHSSSPTFDSIQRIHVDGASWHPSDESYPFLALLQDALWHDRVVKITYLRDNEASERLIHPLGLVTKRGVWYVVAESRGELRTYRVSRLQHAELTNDFFKRPEDFDLGQYWRQSTQAFKSALPSYPANVLIREETMQEFERERYLTVKNTIPSSLAGWLEIEVDFNSLEWGCRVLLSYGSSVLVLSPQVLQEQVRQALIDTTALYESIGQNLVKNCPE
ncbi:helix-turn-helix transcriptional regulator [Paenibacillus agri]|uniref:YafY family transcriptional regulator n=1 Tax=Paenibacillus agri TaxID=2744309 RepID=A0A850EUZ0_9BACL|nr:YafY family protein [Paenibacillus agri]NUU63317.1 YafY family transcriptional regulator [Paenibacillus agri]